jgi:hypothetical protein
VHFQDKQFQTPQKIKLNPGEIPTIVNELVDIDDPPTTLKYIENSCDAQQNVDVNNVGM